MTQNTEQNVRTRDDQAWNGYPQNPTTDGFHWLKQKGCGRLIPFEWESVDEYWLFDCDSDDCYPDSVGKMFDYHGPCLPPEARGAEEQRRKDAEGQEPVAWQWLDAKCGWLPIIHDDPAAHVKEMEEMGIACRPVYLAPANVAALEAEQLARADAEASKARVKALEEALVYLEEEARRFASHYTAHSDGWNTFIIFADKIHARAALTREGGV